MAAAQGYQERIAAFARQLSEEMGEVDASKGVCWLDSIENQAIDFTHAVCYVYAAAMTGRPAAQGWPIYCQWAQWLWEGNTKELIAAVGARSEELGPPEKEDAETSPRKRVARTLGSIKNQQSRMKYAEYRRLGLPITSSHIESTIKQINRRVKGTEKFWHEGAEPLLQLAADHISETTTFDRFWKRRPSRLQATRRYQSAA